jgi:hypothetical protein
MPRRRYKTPTLRRRGASRTARGQIVVFCEGKVTETRYFSDFMRDCRNSLVEVRVAGGIGVPMTIVDRAINEQNLLNRSVRKRSADSFDSIFTVRAVFDFDDHPKVTEAIEFANARGVRVGYSNPCIEFWGLLHFSDSDRPLGRADAQAELKRQMPSYDHARQPVFDFLLLKPNYELAVRRASLGRGRCRDDRQERGNPSTSIDELLEEIRQFSVKNLISDA